MSAASTTINPAICTEFPTETTETGFYITDINDQSLLIQAVLQCTPDATWIYDELVSSCFFSYGGATLSGYRNFFEHRCGKPCPVQLPDRGYTQHGIKQVKAPTTAFDNRTGGLKPEAMLSVHNAVGEQLRSLRTRVKEPLQALRDLGMDVTSGESSSCCGYGNTLGEVIHKNMEFHANRIFVEQCRTHGVIFNPAAYKVTQAYIASIIAEFSC